MRIKLYSNPEGAGWLGWIETEEGEALGFIRLDGTVRWGKE